MDLLSFVEPLFKDKLVQFFVWLALIQILVQVFVDRRVAFWIASIGNTYRWFRYMDQITPLKAWSLIFLILLVFFILKIFFHFNVFLYLRGKKRCPSCFEEVHWRAKVCPHCRHHFKSIEKGAEPD